MPKYKSAPLVAIERVLGRRVTRFMFVSPEDADTATRAGIVPRGTPADKWTNGVDPELFRPAADALERANVRRSLGLDDRHVVVGIVGRIVREKGFRELAAAAAVLCPKYPHLRLLVVGATLQTDRDQFDGRFRQLIADSGLTDRFVFTGHVDNVPELLRAMDVFVLPSYREGFPKSVLEAMASGLPVVATRIRGCREAVIDGVTGFLAPPQTVGPLATALDLLVCDDHARAGMGAAGRRRVLDNYTQARVVSTYLNAVSTLC
jgi:glycosyltransferase involved in cell wall biosynthesis